MLSGAFWINKPAELTSSDVVVRLKIALTKNGYCEKGFKIGHGGTLDPFATGTLVILVGEATKLADSYLHSIKSYSGIISVGTRTDTGDFTGTVVETKRCPTTFGDTPWQKLASTFTQDEYWQTPPMYSAKKQDGRPLHELARQGIEVDRIAILKKIDEFEVTPIIAATLATPHTQDSSDELSFHVRCESGTYVRVIAEDLAKKAGTLAHLKTLVRTQTSDVSLERCSSLEEVQAQLLEKKPVGEIAAFHPMNEVATHLPSIEVSVKEAQEILQGYTKTVHALLGRINSTLSGKYIVARLNEEPIGAPVALFERTSEKDSMLKPTYRLQRVILWQS